MLTLTPAEAFLIFLIVLLALAADWLLERYGTRK